MTTFVRCDGGCGRERSEGEKSAAFGNPWSTVKVIVNSGEPKVYDLCANCTSTFNSKRPPWHHVAEKASPDAL